MPTFYTSSQVAEECKIGASTLRKYVRQFKPFFSEHVRKDRGRRYTRQDILLVLKIKRLFGNGFKESEVRQRLEMVEDNDFMDVAQLLPDITQPIEEAKQTALQLRDEFIAFQETMQSKQNYLADRQIGFENYLVQQWNEYQRLPGWRKFLIRLFGQAPKNPSDFVK